MSKIIYFHHGSRSLMLYMCGTCQDTISKTWYQFLRVSTCLLSYYVVC